MVEAALRTDASPQGPRKLGRYTLYHPVAKGGMAAVYLAQLGGAHGFEQWVAVKVMHPHLAEDRRYVTMFLDEAHVASRIRHPNVCGVLDFGEEDGTPFIVMEYLHGETLAAVARTGWAAGELPLWLSARTVADAARGLHAAHELRAPDGTLRNLVHRDVSPSNILVLYDGVSKIMDFGVAQAENRLTETTAGELKGKFAYMSPEQLNGRPLDRRSDVWAMGVTLWETTLGRRLFRADGEGPTALAVLEREIPDPREIREDYPPMLAELVMSTLRRDPAKRCPSCRVLADGLEQYLLSTGRVVGPDQVAEWMDESFAERRALREDLLSVSEVREDFDPQSQITSGSDRSLGSGFVHNHVSAPAPPRRPSAWTIAVALILAAFGGAGAVFLVSRSGDVVNEGPMRATGTEATASANPSGASAPVNQPARQEQPAEAEQAAAERVQVGPVASSEAAATPSSDEEVAEALRASAEERPVEAPRGQLRGHRRSRPEKARPAPSPAPAAPGRLNLLSIPSADVWLEGRSLGRTPLVGIELPAGRHRLQLRPVEGGEPRHIMVTIRSGERTSQSVSLATLQ